MSCSEPGLVGRARATSRARRGRAMGQRPGVVGPGGDHRVGGVGVAVVCGAGLDAGVAAKSRPEPLTTRPGLDQAGEIREACDVRRTSRMPVFLAGLCVEQAIWVPSKTSAGPYVWWNARDREADVCACLASRTGAFVRGVASDSR